MGAVVTKMWDAALPGPHVPWKQRASGGGRGPSLGSAGPQGVTARNRPTCQVSSPPLRVAAGETGPIASWGVLWLILRSGPGKRPRERGRAAGEEKLLGGGSAAPYIHFFARSLARCDRCAQPRLTRCASSELRRTGRAAGRRGEERGEGVVRHIPGSRVGSVCMCSFRSSVHLDPP